MQRLQELLKSQVRQFMSSSRSKLIVEWGSHELRLWFPARHSVCSSFLR